jgi:fibronectin type 3 domain-containing protein
MALNPTTLTFNPGDTEKTLNVIVNGDFVSEDNNEQFWLNLSNPVNTTLTRTQARGLIIDDDINDESGPELTAFRFEGNPLEQGATLSRSGTLTLTATDGVGVSRVEFWVDGTLFHTDSNGSSQYSALLSPVDVDDGAHTLEIKAYDTLGNASATLMNLNVALAPPTAPVITWPLDGKLTNQAQFNITGTAEKGSDVLLYRDGTLIGEPLTLDKRNTFSGTVALEDGPNNLQAAARNRGGTGPLSDTVIITRDASIPKVPTSLTAQARESGQVRLTWRAPSDDKVIGYDVYRATSAFSTLAAAQKVNAQLLTGTGFDDLVTFDGQYYYCVVALNTVGTTSELSNQVAVFADTTAPRAVIEFSPQGNFDPNSGRIARGIVAITLTVNEVLLTKPFLSLVPDGGIPISIDLTPVTETQYQGQFEIKETTPSGTAYAVFSARDKAGNRGTDIDAGASIKIDSQGPLVTQLTLLPNNPIRNDQNNPVTVQVSLELDEALPAGQIPQLSYKLSGAGRSTQAITPLTPTSDLVWSASFSLPADAGLNATENLQFSFRAEDDLQNVSTKIQGDNHFQIYQGELPPLWVPLGLVGTALPEGRIHLSWKAVLEATDYQLLRQAPGETNLSVYQRSNGALEFTDITTQDGFYRYAVASIRVANDQEGISANSNIVKVNADSVAPDAPTNLQLELVGAGIKATWETPANSEPLTYNLYRATEAIQSVSELTPIKTWIETLSVIDNAPSKTAHYYVVTAIDAVGNESVVSESAYLNFDLLPVATLEVVQDGEDKPVVSWTHSASDLSGFDIYIGPETQRVKVNDSPLLNTTYIDTGYQFQERVYTVVAIDNQGVESPGRTVVLPHLTAQLSATPIIRAQFNTLVYQVTNHSAQTVTAIQLQTQLGNYISSSAPFALFAGETADIPVMVGGYADLADLSQLVTTMVIRPNTGEVARLSRQSEVEVRDGSGLVVSLQSQQLTRGGVGQVKFTLENTSAVAIEIQTATGANQAADEITFLLKDSDDNVLAARALQRV